MSNYRDVTVQLESELSDILSILDREVVKKIVLVVDKQNRLHGTITDGDVRRALLSGATTASKASNVMFKEFKYIKPNMTAEEIRQTFERYNVEQLPMIDEGGKLIGLHLLAELPEKTGIQAPVVIMAGGLGSRLKPLTDNCPKPMLHLGGKPILELIVESLKKQGFSKFYIAINYLGEQISGYFGNGEKFGVSIEYLQEDKRLGTAGALSLLPQNIRSEAERIVILNGDVLTQVDLTNLLQFHVDTQSDVTMCVRDYSYQVPFGVVSTHNSRVTQIVEKPIEKYFVNAGIYCLNTALLKNFSQQEYLDMPDLITTLMEQDALINAFPVHEYWMDIGQHEQLKQARVDFNSQHE